MLEYAYYVILVVVISKYERSQLYLIHNIVIRRYAICNICIQYTYRIFPRRIFSKNINIHLFVRWLTFVSLII